MQIIVKLTTACNFACSYCSEGNQALQELSPTLFYHLVDGLPRLMERCGKKNIDILWHGGEPLLYGHERLAMLMDYANNNLQGFNIRFLMQTNGSLIDDKWLTCFKQYNILPGISFDGLPRLHNQHRRTKDGKPTANIVLANLQKLREAGFNPNILMILDTTEPIDSSALLEFIKKYRLNTKIHPVIPCGRAEDRKDEEVHKIYENYIQLLKELYEKCVNDYDSLNIEPLDSLVSALLYGRELSECSFNGSCARDFICLYPDGEVGFCGRDNASRRLTYGNIKETDILDLYESDNARIIRARNAYLRLHECKNCDEWKFCQGGCSFEAMNYYGKINAPYNYCVGRKKLLRYLRTDGLKLLKQRLLAEKQECRGAIKAKEELLEETKIYAKQ